MQKCVLVTEANETVASGHLMEMIELSSVLERDNVQTVTFVNKDAPQSLKKRLKGIVAEYDGNAETAKGFIAESIKSHDVGVVVTDLRQVTEEWIDFIRSKTGCRIVCIDEFGGRYLSADTIVNPMVDPAYWNYDGSNADIVAGNQYLILPLKISDYHKRKKALSNDICTVSIAMGGVDYYGSTIKILDWIVKEYPNIHWNIIVGAGFKYRSSLDERISVNCENVVVYQDIDYIYDLFFQSDMAFCAGGNTLHELACIGTPALVIPTMPHEYQNGKRFESLGFGKCVSDTRNVTEPEVKTAFEEMADRKVREKMSLSGKTIADGEGCRRNVEIIKRLI